MKMPVTKQGARRQCDAMIRRWRKALAGGLMFGLDWATVRVTFPDDFARYRAIAAAFEYLPERKRR